MKKALLVHPLRHHSYYSLKGMQNYIQNGYGFYGYYNKNDFIDLSVKLICASKLQGYSADFLDNKFIITNSKCKIGFLMAKSNPKYINEYLEFFDRNAAKKVKEYQILHVLQDYCNSTIREAIKSGIPYVYEQIQPFDFAQIECLKREIEIAGFPKSYIENRFPKEKTEKQLENLEYATAIIAASATTEKSLVGYTNKPIYTFPYGASFSGISKVNYIRRNKQESKTLQALYVGSISLIKGVHYLISLAKKLESVPIHFTFVGNPVVEEDQRLVKEILKLKNSTYIKEIPHTQIGTVYQKNDVFLFQGLCEGFGMVTLEAMAYGLPCLVSVGGRGVVENGVTGYINCNGDVESLVNNLLQLYNDREKLYEMGSTAIKAVKKYSWEKFSNNIANTYKSVFH